MELPWQQYIRIKFGENIYYSKPQWAQSVVNAAGTATVINLDSSKQAAKAYFIYLFMFNTDVNQDFTFFDNYGTPMFVVDQAAIGSISLNVITGPFVHLIEGITGSITCNSPTVNFSVGYHFITTKPVIK